MGGTNIFSPLQWVIRQPIHRGHPRLLFLLTSGAISNTGKVLELLRNHSCSTRYGRQQGSPLRGQKTGTVGDMLLHLTDVPASEIEAGEIAGMSHGRTSKGLEQIPEVQMLFKQSKAG